MTPGPGDNKAAEKSYLSSAVESINPWGSKRTASPAPSTRQGDVLPASTSTCPVDTGDHSTSRLYGQSFRSYPPDCPPLAVQWFHAVDVPKRRPKLAQGKKSTAETKLAGPPKKFSAFSTPDSRSIEARYQKQLETMEAQGKQTQLYVDQGSEARSREDAGPKSSEHVAVNEDFLFDVNIQERELAPVYWVGPVYEVRRGTWFFQEGNVLRPCEENLAAQLEEGYLKTKPWINSVRPRSPSGAKQVTPARSSDNIQTVSEAIPTVADEKTKPANLEPGPVALNNTQPQGYRLFGTYMNSVITYQDATTAWLSSDTMLSWVTSSVYERFAGGGYMSGVKLTRGYSESPKSKDRDKEKGTEGSKGGAHDEEPPENPLGLDERQQRLLKRRSAPPTTKEGHEDNPGNTQGREARLQRQLSSLIEGERRTTEDTEKQLQEKQEEEIQGYHSQAGESQGREIEHLVLVTHGIGQQLSLRMESVNFVQDVNTMRKTLKTVYAGSDDLKALNSEFETGPGNCRVQVLPVCWRHLLEFPKQRDKRGEHDLGDFDEEEYNYPSLEDITIEGVAFARSLISDLALDVLLYQSSYRNHISRIVRDECNRIVALFKERNPGFRGKVHVMGHSLGSAILFDILCRQKEKTLDDETRNPLRIWPAPGDAEARNVSSALKKDDIDFDFPVGDFYCLGSPIGLFQMLEGRTIAARQTSHDTAGLGRDWKGLGTSSDPLRLSNSGSVDGHPKHLATEVSSPKTEQLFNIFHPSDPISYRLEPLISPAMTSLKPQGLPYTKKGIFGNVANQGFTGIGVKVGQSVSGLWSSLSAGIASNIINRSLGLSSEEAAQLAEQVQRSPNGNLDAVERDLSADASRIGEDTSERKKQLADPSMASTHTATSSGNDPTLIDDELETLFSQFQKRRAESGKEGEGQEAAEHARDNQKRARRLRKEEAKVRALNRNGRVDYSIQESVLDFNPMNTIASHMTYWGDLDVNHFVLSQLLSNRKKSS